MSFALLVSLDSISDGDEVVLDFDPHVSDEFSCPRRTDASDLPRHILQSC